MQRNISNTRKLQHALLLGAASVAAIGLAAPAFAQDQGTVETVVVTGSHIATTNLTTTSPVSELSSEDIKTRGTTRIEDLINQLPQAFAAQTSTASNSSTGTATVDLRGLGAVRTLVLIDGQRMPFGSPINPAADLNEIPAQMVDRIEVQTGGASAVYGSDAIAGVVNFIMKKDFEGLQLDFSYGGFQHDNDYHHGGDNLRNTIAERGAVNPAQFKLPKDSVFDGETKSASAIMGISSADGKGNITAYVSYHNTQAILQSQRDFSACALGGSLNGANTDGAGNPSPGTPANSQFTCGGSSTSFPGRFTDFGLNDNSGPGPDGISGTADDVPDTNPLPSFNKTVNLANGTFIPFNKARNQYNYGPTNFYQRPDERYSFGAFGHYNVNPHAEVYTQLMFTSYSSKAQIAPSGDFFVTSTINCDNPLLSSQQKSTIGCGAPALLASVTINPDTKKPFLADSNRVPMYIGRRDIEGGPRFDDFLYQSFRIVGGVKGEIVKGWTYDLSGQYSRVQLSDVFQNDFSKTRLKRALDVVNVGGVPTCRVVANGSTDPVDQSCVPYDIFTGAGPSKAAINYLVIPLVRQGDTTLQDITGIVNGDLGTLGIVSPFAKSPVQVALGFEYRQDGLTTITDASYQTFDGAGQNGAQLPVHGTTNVTEGFAELNIPVMEDMPFAKLVTIDTAYRYSSYNTGVVTNTWKVGGDWSPIEDVRLRAGYQHAVRAPNVIELFTATTFSLFDRTAGDPCGALSQGKPGKPVSGGGPATLAQCVATGVPAGQYGSSALDSPAAQYNNTQGGNLDLKPEKSNTITLGAVFTPTFLHGFNLTVDYFDIRVDNLISTIGANSVLSACYDNNIASQCAKIHRTPGGALWLGNGHIDTNNTNIGGLKTTGVDINANYQFDIADAVHMASAGTSVGDAGSLTFNLVGTYLGELKTNTGVPGAPVINCAGQYAGDCESEPTSGIPAPRWRHQFRTTWLSPWDDIALSLTWRYIGEVTLKGGDPNADLDFKLDSQNYFDLAATVPLLSNTTLRVGVNNVSDNDPPITRQVGTTGNGNTYPQTYDALGRFVFADIQVNL